MIAQIFNKQLNHLFEIKNVQHIHFTGSSFNIVYIETNNTGKKKLLRETYEAKKYTFYIIK